MRYRTLGIIALDDSAFETKEHILRVRLIVLLVDTLPVILLYGFSFTQQFLVFTLSPQQVASPELMIYLVAFILLKNYLFSFLTIKPRAMSAFRLFYWTSALLNIICLTALMIYVASHSIIPIMKQSFLILDGFAFAGMALIVSMCGYFFTFNHLSFLNNGLLSDGERRPSTDQSIYALISIPFLVLALVVFEMFRHKSLSLNTLAYVEMAIAIVMLVTLVIINKRIVSPLKNLRHSLMHFYEKPEWDAINVDNEFSGIKHYIEWQYRQNEFQSHLIYLGSQLLSESATTRVQLYRTLIESMQTLTQMPIVNLFLYNRETQVFSRISWVANSSDILKQPIAMENSEWLMQFNHLENIIERHDQFVESYIQEQGLEYEIGLPLQTPQDFLGVVLIACHQKDFQLHEFEKATIKHAVSQVAILLHAYDLIQQKQFEERQYEKTNLLASVTLNSIGDGVITTNNDGLIEYLNPVAEKLTNVNLKKVYGQPLLSVFHLLEEESGKLVESPVDRCLKAGKSITLTGHTLLQTQDQEFAVEVRLSPMRDVDDSIIGVVLVFHDVTELHVLASELAYQATHDALTGLINRREFENRLDHVLSLAREQFNQHALCYIDLDQFKVVNDICGHIAGDELLQQLGTRLSSVIRETDVLGRLGGDEFGLLLHECPLDNAQVIANNILKLAKDFRFVWHDKSFEIGVSIGLVSIDSKSGNIADILSAADSACYVAKDLGRNRVHVFEQNDLELVQRRGEMQWLQIIRHAIENDDLVLMFQPIKNLATNEHDFHSGEILLRMRSKDSAFISPGSFLPAAERYHLMPELDRWVLKTALNYIASIASDATEQFSFSINLSAQSLSDDKFLNYVIDTLGKTRVPTRYICFEITETTAIANFSRAIHFISTLRSMGCRFSLDDFGSGLSSFSYLKNLPVDYIKIDGSFIKDIIHNPIDEAMVEAINQIGHLMGIKSIAEFVNNEAIYNRLKKIGVDFAQGNYVSQPVLFDEYLAPFIKKVSQQ